MHIIQLSDKNIIYRSSAQTSSHVIIIIKNILCPNQLLLCFISGKQSKCSQNHIVVWIRLPVRFTLFYYNYVIILYALQKKRTKKKLSYQKSIIYQVLSYIRIFFFFFLLSSSSFDRICLYYIMNIIRLKTTTVAVGSYRFKRAGKLKFYNNNTCT